MKNPAANSITCGVLLCFKFLSSLAPLIASSHKRPESTLRHPGESRGPVNKELMDSRFRGNDGGWLHYGKLIVKKQAIK